MSLPTKHIDKPSFAKYQLIHILVFEVLLISFFLSWLKFNVNFVGIAKLKNQLMIANATATTTKGII